MRSVAYDRVECFNEATGRQDFSPLGTECTHIQGAENRAITLVQLKRVAAFIVSRASGDDGILPWIDLAPSEYSSTSGEKLHLQFINLYQVLTYHERIMTGRPLLAQLRSPVTGERLGYQACHRQTSVQPGGADVPTRHGEADSYVVCLALLVRLFITLHYPMVPMASSLLRFMPACGLRRNEPVLDFVLAIEEHARVRGMSHDDAWWVW